MSSHFSEGRTFFFLYFNSVCSCVGLTVQLKLSLTPKPKESDVRFGFSDRHVFNIVTQKLADPFDLV